MAFNILSMRLIWKLLRQHISIPQFTGFFLASLFGMLVVLLGFQFYHDVLPVFTSEDSFMRADYLIVNKKVGAADAVSGRSNSFSESEVEELCSQKSIARVGAFSRAAYHVDISMEIEGANVLNSEFFLESIPDEFIDVPLQDWQFDEDKQEVPVILPRTYLTMYNLAFAPGKSLPRLSEGLIGMVDLTIYVQGNGLHESFHGHVIGFSSRQTTILVPQAFMDWSNKRYAPADQSDPVRLIIEVGNPADENIGQYLDDHGYEIDDDKLLTEKTTYFLRMLVMIVVVVGILISLLSFYILLLSIYLLVQKNTLKLQHLMLMGYTPAQVAFPYQILTILLNALVQSIAFPVLCVLRKIYMDMLLALYPQADENSILPAILLGGSLFLTLSLINIFVIYCKMRTIWKGKVVQ